MTASTTKRPLASTVKVFVNTPIDSPAVWANHDIGLCDRCHHRTLQPNCATACRMAAKGKQLLGDNRRHSLHVYCKMEEVKDSAEEGEADLLLMVVSGWGYGRPAHARS